MNGLPKSEVATGVLRFLLLTLRYSAAVVVAFVTSMVTLMSLLNLMEFAVWQFFIPIMFLIGFVGVFAGSFCVPWNSRWQGAVFLLLVGIGYSLFLSVLMGGVVELDAPNMLLTLGGMLAVFFQFRRQRRRLRSNVAASSPVLDNGNVQTGSLSEKETGLSGNVKGCVACEKGIPVEATICPRCGWTQPI